MTSLRVAAFQRRPLSDDIDEIISRVSADLAWCAGEAVALAIFPECYLQGYADDYLTIRRRAIPLDGAVFGSVLDRLAPFATTIILGVIERRAGSLYNSAVVLTAGVTQGVYAKTHLNENGFEAGSKYPIFHASGWCFGVNICYDAKFAEPAQRLRDQGARLIAYPLNNLMRRGRAQVVRPLSFQNLQARARQTGCWIASADVVGESGERLSYGCTCIVQPDGEIVARVSEGAEGAALFDLACMTDGAPRQST